MASLLTQCPHCQTSFRVSRSQLAVAEGQVRCGSCLGVFSALDNEIRVKPPQPPLLDQPLTEEELSSVTAAELDADDDNVAATDTGYEETPPPRERSGSWLDDDDDEFDYEREVRSVAPPAQVAAAAVEEEDDAPDAQEPEARTAATEEDDVREEYTGEEYDDAYATEYDDEPLLREPVLSFAADDAEPAEDLAGDEEDEVREEYADEEDDDEPRMREPVLSFADEEEPSFSATPRRDARAEPDFSLYADDAEPGFSAIDGDDEAEDGGYRSVRSRYAAPTRDEDKRQVRRYVEELEDEEALDELSPDTLAYLDDEPVHIAPERAPRRFWSSLLLGLGSLALLGVLGLQFINANIEELSQSARFRLLSPYLCQVLTCPPLADAPVPSTLVSEQLVVRAHPTTRDALEVSAVLRNNGAATQPLPGVELIFRDAQDRILASRVFTPDEYLPPELRTASELPSQSTVQLRMEMANPGPEALNYELALRPLPNAARR